MKKYYKVLRQHNKNLVSAVIDNPRVRYRVGRWVSAPKEFSEIGYHLLCFNSLSSAKIFASDSCVIYECEVGDVVRKKRIFHLGGGFGSPVFVYAGRPVDDYTWPSGTVMAKRIKLIKRVT